MTRHQLLDAAAPDAARAPRPWERFSRLALLHELQVLLALVAARRLGPPPGCAMPTVL